MYWLTQRPIHQNLFILFSMLKAMTLYGLSMMLGPIELDQEHYSQTVTGFGRLTSEDLLEQTVRHLFKLL